MFKEKLQLRLQSDEPKCANCKHWFADDPPAHLGLCKRLLIPQDVYTIDLAVCSKWERAEEVFNAD